MHKKESGQAYCKNILNRSLQKFILYFMSFLLFITNFITLKALPEI
jgi:hypothetical protein